MTINKLTAKQKKFCEHYASSGNATQAAILAGYSRKTAHSSGQRLLKNVEIRNYLKNITDGETKARILAAEERQAWLCDIIRGEVQDSVVTADGNIINRPAKISDRIRAAELVAKMRGELSDRHTVDNVVKIQPIPKFETIEDYIEWKKKQLAKNEKPH